MRGLWICTLCILAAAALAARGHCKGYGVKMTDEGIILENVFGKLVIGKDGRCADLIYKRTGKSYIDPKSPTPFASVKRGGKVQGATAASFDSGLITLSFGDTGASAKIRADVKPRYFMFEVVSLTGEDIEELTFAESRLSLKGSFSEPFACCAMALNLKTNVPEIPGLNSLTRAICYPRFGFEGASVAIVACPPNEMRSVMKEVVTVAPDLPKCKNGGPWALNAEINCGSYLFNFADLTEKTVDDWIKVAKTLGMNQIDFHGGTSFRFGDCRPNPDLYPNGRASLRAVIDRLHAAGIKAGLHTYAFFIDKSCPWVTPVPHPGLGKKATFTLAEDLSKDAKTVTVVEPTDKVSTITGFFERNSVTLQIDDELIAFSAASKEPPHTFTVAERGACGTRVSAHAKGAKAHHLTECFGLFAPGGDSNLLVEVAKANADTFNECGFDMMYLDALDGEDVLGGAENAWHYGSKFTFELVKRLKRPVLMEMSTFHHHLWYARSRIGATDHPSRGQKRFIDIHCQGSDSVVHVKGNSDAARMFLAAELGWWTIVMADDVQVERTFPDDIEYLMARCLATDTGFALMGVNPDTIKTVPVYQTLAPIFRQYEELRYAGYFSESAKERLHRHGAEFTLEQDGAGGWRFRPVAYTKHKVSIASGEPAIWTATNNFAKQPLQVRIEALMSAASYDSPDAVVLAEPGTVTSGNDSLMRFTKVFSPTLDLGQRQAIGVWVTGDGQGEILNLKLKSPPHVAWGLGDHYVDVNFTGRRYFELVEPESDRALDYEWPYSGDLYGIFREKVNYSMIEWFSIWYNNLPAGKTASCEIGPVKALPLVKSKLINPRITVNGSTITFPIEIESGSYIEFRSLTDCKVYGPKGELVAEVKPTGPVPELAPGSNEITFSCEAPSGVSARAWMTVMTKSEETFR